MTPPPDEPDQAVLARLAAALSAAQQTALTQEQIEDVVYKAQVMEQMRLNRFSALTNIGQLATDFDRYLAEHRTTDPAAQAVLRKFAELELVAYADRLRVALGQADDQLIKSAVTSPQRVIEVTDVTPREAPKKPPRQPIAFKGCWAQLLVAVVTLGLGMMLIEQRDTGAGCFAMLLLIGGFFLFFYVGD